LQAQLYYVHATFLKPEVKQNALVESILIYCSKINSAKIKKS